MRAVSESWREEILRSHRVATKVFETTSMTEIPIVGGSVTLDATASVRGTGSLRVADPMFAPLGAGDLLAPYGNELDVSRGIDRGGGDVELVRLGIFRIGEQVTVNVDGSTELSITDRAQKVIDAVFEDDEQWTGEVYTDLMQAILVEAVEDLVFDFPVRDLTAPTLDVFRGDDRWEFVRAMASFMGMELFFDNDGVCVLRGVPTADTEPVAYLVEGQDVSVELPSLTDFSKVLSRAETHNKWIVIGDNPNEAGAPPVGTAIDDDENSPTNYYGTFGKKPEIFSTSMVIEEDQAYDAAEGKKAKESGLSQSVNFGALVDPALEPGDVVRITRTVRGSDGELVELADENHVIDSLTIPLEHDGTMTGTTRSTRV